MTHRSSTETGRTDTVCVIVCWHSARLLLQCGGLVVVGLLPRLLQVGCWTQAVAACYKNSIIAAAGAHCNLFMYSRMVRESMRMHRQLPVRLQRQHTCTTALSHLWMPFLSPSAWEKAEPSARAMSSTVWWSSIQVSPSAST